MKILETHVYRGASYWAPVPVIRFLLQSEELEKRLANGPSGFRERLAATLPTLHQHACSGDHNAAFLDRLGPEMTAGHVVQHTALELQNMARQKIDANGAYFATPPADKTSSGLCNAIFGYEQEDIGIAAGELAVRLLESLL
jgi:cyanophycin synthetase